MITFVTMIILTLLLSTIMATIFCVSTYVKLAVSWRQKKPRPMLKYQKLQYPEWPVENGSKSESVHTRQHVKMLNFTTKIIIKSFKAWY